MSVKISEFQDILSRLLLNDIELVNKNTDPFKFREQIIKSAISYIEKFVTEDVSNINNLSTSEIEHIKYFQEQLSKSEVDAIGLHFIDKVSGRISHLDFPINSYKRKSLLDLFNKFNETKAPILIELFSDLWMLGYKEVVKTNSSLVNAYYDDLLPWTNNDKSIELSWGETDSDKLSHLEVNQINLRFDDEFVDLSGKIALDVWNILVDVLISKAKDILDDVQIKPYNSAYDRFLDLLFDEVRNKIDELTIYGRLQEAVNISRSKILHKTEIGNLFFKKLELLSFGKDTEIFDGHSLSEIKDKWYKNNAPNQSVRNHYSWLKTKTLLECMQSAMLSEYSFCGSSGYNLFKYSTQKLMYGEKHPELDFYLILVSSNCKCELQEIKKIFGLFYESINEVYKNIYKQKETDFINFLNNESHNDDDVIVDNIAGRIKKIKSNNFDKNVIKRWTQIVHNLSKEAVHESKNVSFLVGFGPQIICDVYFKTYLKIKEKLSQINSEIDQIVHFIKSYYSIFEHKNNKVIWFDDYGRFIGIYDYSGNLNALLNHKQIQEKTIFTMIHSKNEFDVYSGSVNPIIRIKGGKIIDIINTNLKESISIATSKIQINTDGLPNAINAFLYDLSTSAQSKRIGTSMIVVNSDIKHNKDDWKHSLETQSKKLTFELEKFSNPFLSIKDFINIFSSQNDFLIKEKIINEVLLLTKLDGSLLIELKDEKLYISPSNFALPLYKDENKDTRHFDYFKLKNDKSTDGKVEDVIEAIETGNTPNFELIKDFINKGDEIENTNKPYKNLTFLNSAGTRHHSLWGLSLTTTDSLFVVTVSESSEIRVFWNGLYINGK